MLHYLKGTLDFGLQIQKSQILHFHALLMQIG